jgi:TRAP-type uncharacterized transport system substrate-binding protein
MTEAAEQFLAGFLRRLQRNKKVRASLAGITVAVLLGLAGSFLYEALPREYELSITGADVLSSRHHLARKLQQEAAGNGVALRIVPMSGSLEALNALDDGTLDLALVQDGLSRNYPNVRQVAYVGVEQLHLLARSEIVDITELRSKLINLGSTSGTTRAAAKEVMDFSGLNDGVDYVETNFTTEELLNLREDKLPDGIFVSSLIPNDLVEFLVKERSYSILEIPFPEALALRYGWVANSGILAYAYSVDPPVPSRDVKTIGINMHLLANKDVDPLAVFRVLESIYSPTLESPPNLKIDEIEMTKPSGYPISDGALRFLERKNPLLSASTLDELEAIFGVVLTVLSSVLVAVRWFKGEADDDEGKTDDQTFVTWINDVATVEAKIESLRGDPAATPAAFCALQSQLLRIKTAALDKVGGAKLDNTQLPNVLLLSIADARANVSRYTGERAETT